MFPAAEFQSLILGAATSKVQDRVWRNRFPADGATLPRVSWQKTNTDHHGTHDGPSGLGVSEIEVACEALTEAEVEALAGVVNTLDGYRSDGPVYDMTATTDNDEPEPPQEGAEKGFSRIRLRFKASHAE